MKKRIMVLATCLLVLWALPAFAAMDAATALDMAKQLVPADAQHLTTKDDGEEYEVKFVQKATNTYYKVEISKLGEYCKELTIKTVGDLGSQKVVLSEQEARDIVLNSYPQAEIYKIELDQDNGYKKYEVKFSIDSTRGEMEINPESGAVMETTLKY